MRILKILLLVVSVFLMSIKTSTSAEKPSVSVKKNALIVVTSHNQLGNTGKQTGFWLCEATHAYLILERNGYKVDFVSPRGGKAPIDERSKEPDNPVNKTFYEKKEAVSKLENTLKPKDINADDYSIVVFIGGHGALWDFVNNSQLRRIASKIYFNGGIVAAIEHGPAALLGSKLPDGKKLLEGKNVTASTNEQEKQLGLEDKVLPISLEDELKKEGANFSHSPIIWQPRVSISERLVTGQNTASMKPLLEVVEKLIKDHNL